MGASTGASGAVCRDCRLRGGHRRVSAAITRQLDVTGTFCPLPILLAAREMLGLEAGDRLEIVGDDPAILEDMPVWCERAGHRLVEIADRDGTIVSVVEKGERPPGGARLGRAAAAGKPQGTAAAARPPGRPAWPGRPVRPGPRVGPGRPGRSGRRKV
jgi:tRNA 2-thiouridine synthesizing protein A